MTNKQITQLPTITPDAADELAVYDVSGSLTGKAAISDLVGAGGAEAAIYTARGSTPQTGIGTSFVKLTGFANDGVSDGATADQANNRVTVDIAGTYQISLDVSFSGTLSTTFSFEIYVNGASVDIGMQRKLGTGGDVGIGACGRPVAIGAGQDVEVYVKADGSSKSITPVYMNLFVHRVS